MLFYLKKNKKQLRYDIYISVIGGGKSKIGKENFCCCCCCCCKNALQYLVCCNNKLNHEKLTN